MADDSFIYSDIYGWSAGDCPEEAGPFRNSGFAVIRALNSLDEHAKKLAKEKYLSAEGAEKMLAPHQAKVVDEVAQQLRVVSVAAAQLKAAEDSVFSPAALEPGDSVGASNDMRLQAWYDGLDANTRDEFEAQAREGKHPDIVKSLARSPVPGRARAFGLTSYRAEMARKNPVMVRALEERRRGLAWAEGVLRRAPRVAVSDPSSTKAPETAIEKMTRARLYMKPASTA